MKLLNNDETRSFVTLEELKEFAKKQEIAYCWDLIKTSEGYYLPLDDAPILISILRKDLEISPDVSDETILEQMQDSKLLLSYFDDEGEKKVYPIGQTAYRGVFSRIGGTCPALTALQDTRARNEVSPNDKAEICNTLAKYSKGNSQILKGDEQILAALSDDYVRLPFTLLLDEAEMRLKGNFEFIEYKEGRVSHESSAVDFMFRDSEIDNNLFDAFDKIGKDVSTYDTYIKVVTSDVGLSGANVYPYIKDSKAPYNTISIGLPIKMEHLGDASIEKFGENILSSFSMFRDFVEHLEQLSEIKIFNPADCLYHVGKKVTLPDKALRETYEDFDKEFPYSCSGADIYVKLFEVLDQYSADEKIGDIRTMQMNENITRICFNSLKTFDKPVLSK